MLIPWMYFLQKDEQLLIESPTNRWVVNGPGRVITKPMWHIERRRALSLGSTEYLTIQNSVSGEKHNKYGPALVFLEADEDISEMRDAIALKRNEYLRLFDTKTGEIRVVRGETAVYLEPNEEILQDVTEAINIDQEHAILVRNLQTGQQSLITERQTFVPAPDQEIITLRKRIRLEDKEAMVLKDGEGRYLFRRGTDRERSFFLQPYEKIIELHWSSGLHKDSRGLKISRFDLRPKFMWYEFEARTRDNVELIIGITFFWEIFDLEQMLMTTDDTPGDVCAHARSAILQAVSRVTLESFLDSFNPIIEEAVMSDTSTFYLDRGVKLHSVEVRSVASKDPSTQKVLQEIINETTNRINRLQQQESQNEVKLRQIQGDIETERQRTELLKLQREHALIEGQIKGETEATRIQSFLDILREHLPQEQQLAVFNTLRKQEAYEALSNGNAQLFFTPADADLTIRTNS